MKYKVAAFDLDGTLTNTEKKVTPATKARLKEAAALGITIVLASGRPLIGMKRVAQELDLAGLGGYLIAYNGGEIYDCREQRAIFRAAVPAEYYGGLCALAREYGVQPLTYTETSVLAETDREAYVRKEAYNNTIPITVVDRLEEHIRRPVTKLMAVGEPEKLQGLRGVLERKYGERLGIFFSEPYFLEIVPKGIEKANALEQLLGTLKLGREQLIAFGDGLNDIPMLSYAGFAVAMGNAYPEVKERADYITGSNEEDGVASAIEKLILQYGEEKRT